MTLDEAIAKAKADGDVQLAQWLRQARGADAAAKWYTEKLRDANRTIRKLLDENAKLIVKLNAEHIVRQNMEIENTKLRELMSVMAYCNQFRRDCDGCRMNGKAGTITERAGCDELLDYLRDAGIEVPS